MASSLEDCDCPLCYPGHIIPDDASVSSWTEVEDEEQLTTPLPKIQLFIVIVIQIAEPVTSTVIYPFVNDLVRAIGITGGNERKTGYYVGVVASFPTVLSMESIFYAAEALTVLHWGRASDTIGRRPILLGGMIGLAGSMIGFGLSKRYWMLILSRCAQGAFNGNIGVTKSVMAEITDVTNSAQAFSFLPVAWSVGSTLGPFIGGVFAEPVKRWPELFGNLGLFKSYPYLLPCMMATVVPVFAFLLAFLGLKETLPPAANRGKQIKPVALQADESASATSRLLHSNSSATIASRDYGATSGVNTRTPSTPGTPQKPAQPIIDATPPPFRAILIPRVLIPITNYGFLAFLDQSLLVLLPLIYSTPLHLGGLGLSPSTIGTILGVWGVINGIFQITCFAWVRRNLDHRNCYMLGIICLGVCFALFPIIARLAAWDGCKVGGWAWLGITLQLGAYTFSYMSYACMFMYVAASAPSRSSLGVTNGLAQLTASSVRALAPSAASSLFSFSLELYGGRSDLGGHLVYIVLCAISAIAFWWSFRLPCALEGEEE